MKKSKHNVFGYIYLFVATVVTFLAFCKGQLKQNAMAFLSPTNCPVSSSTNRLKSIDDIASVKAHTPDDFNSPKGIANLLCNDMWNLNGIDSSSLPSNYNVDSSPSLKAGNTMPNGWQGFMPWGQVYVKHGSSPDSNIRIELKNLTGYILIKDTNTWKRVSFSHHMRDKFYTKEGGPHSNAFEIDVKGDSYTTHDNTTSISLSDNQIYRFWTSDGQSNIDSSKIAGICTTCQVRLIPNNNTTQVDESKYVVQMGADYWEYHGVNQNKKPRPYTCVGYGCYRYVTKEWNTYTMCTITDSKLLKDNPPPIYD